MFKGMKFRLQLAFCIAGVLVLSLSAFSQPGVPSFGTEDLSSASIASSHLVQAVPQLEDRDEEPQYVSEWVTVQWRSGDPIYLYVVRPTKATKSSAIIYLYDYPAETDVYRDDDWCKRATAGGYAAVGFVPALNGHRYHDIGMKDWFVSEMQESLAKSVHDVQMVINYLDTRGDVDANSVGIYGEGAGATIALIAASVDSRITTIDMVDPWANWPLWMSKSNVVPDEERPAYVKPEFLKKIVPFDPVSLLPGLNTPHVRLDQHDSNFGETPEKVKDDIEMALPKSAEKHRFANSTKPDGGLDTEEHRWSWVKEQLGTNGAVSGSGNKRRQ